jgi:hypothetical protein
MGGSISFRSREIHPVCGGEAARNAIVITADAVDPDVNSGRSVRFTEQQFYTPEPRWEAHRGMYAVRFEPIAAPPFYQSVSDDFAFLYMGDAPQLSPQLSMEVNIPRYPDGLFRTSYSIDRSGLVVMVVAPPEMTFVKCSPRPIIAKISKRQRIGIAWAFYAESDRPATAYLQWGFESVRVVEQSALDDILTASAISAATSGNELGGRHVVDPSEIHRRIAVQ